MKRLAWLALPVAAAVLAPGCLSEVTDHQNTVKDLRISHRIQDVH